MAKSYLGVHRNATILRDVLFACNDGIITTFAAVAGVTGASLPVSTVLIMGFANLFADGFAMATGNYLATKSEEEYEEGQGMKKGGDGSPLLHAVVTFVAFNIAGLLPLTPFLYGVGAGFGVSLIIVSLSLFVIGAMRSFFTKKEWWRAGIEMLLVGGIAALVAYFTGHFIEGYLGNIS